MARSKSNGFRLIEPKVDVSINHKIEDNWECTATGKSNLPGGNSEASF
jgi:hypothetical protein